ncbi:hypothetical protein VITFI_CDS2198 [Vitreoscilla filiformis]|uniref:DUF1800 domain-containing protein n=1 Tax=Vitreoscilla filiformis TaxID=63 RepID=A0A221KG16_VITFI|nr:DUF1800 family protein [Vitreoscilla filiformis]ASM77976.1 hypothetical protein VITFI_CDS2198 [Vitreoscilla filiformis]
MNRWLFVRTLPWALALSVAGCGGGEEAGTDGRTADSLSRTSADVAEAASPVSQLDAVRLAHQASFGPNEALVRAIRQQGIPEWIQAQMTATGSAYTSGGSGNVHQNVGNLGFCGTGAQANNPYCWRDHFSTEPLTWDFYRNAVSQPDQLRQRVALALHQLLVVSGVEIGGTYGLRKYQSIFLNQAFGNYREVLKQVTLSPVMGDYLNHVNNDKKSPNENYARELLQLFSLGTCRLTPNGQLMGNRCVPTYDNAVVRNYAYALTGWTYPPGGSTVWGCWPEKTNCQYYGGNMVPLVSFHDKQQRTLLSGVTVPANATPEQALAKVLDSLMIHGNMPPFIARHLIQNLVRSNPSSDYVERVVTAFRTGHYVHAVGGKTFRFGKGVRGDLAASVAAVLLDTEARTVNSTDTTAGKLRSPVLQITGALRALNGYTDGAPFTWWWGETMMMHVHRAPSVFSYYPPNFPVPGKNALVGPEFGIHNVSTTMTRLNLYTYLLDWGGSKPDSSIPNATGTQVNTLAFQSDADQPGVLVDRLSKLLLGKTLNASLRQKVIYSVSYWTSRNSPSDWRDKRVRAAAWLILSSPEYLVQS